MNGHGVVLGRLYGLGSLGRRFGLRLGLQEFWFVRVSGVGFGFGFQVQGKVHAGTTLGFTKWGLCSGSVACGMSSDISRTVCDGHVSWLPKKIILV